MLEVDYRFAWFDGLNRFYIAAEKAYLATAFAVQPNVFDDFVRYSEASAKAQLAQALSSQGDVEATKAELIVQRERVSALAAELEQARAHGQQLDAARQTAEIDLAAQRAQAEALTAEAAQLAAALAKANTRAQQLDAVQQANGAELVSQSTRVDHLTVQTARLASERDAWMQELFEVNRHAAHLTQVRQNLLQAIDADRLQLARIPHLEAEKVQLHDYILVMYASTSWKFARPVRAIAKLLRRH